MVTLTEQYLTDIANAIREKNRTSTQYTPGQMAERIESLNVVNTASAPNPSSFTEICDNTYGVKAKTFTVSFGITNTVSSSSLTMFVGIVNNGLTETGRTVGLIRKSTNTFQHSSYSGDFKSISAGGSSNNPVFNTTVSVPAGESRTVILIGYRLGYK